ncbi:hypothetical protein MPTK1_7g13770 [Marchantia polymorpha subsp. ruderalis]|uniref:Uncharacterized protein n=2 Tax=Marchantia polymorpha TaxID=3197 RepID=A0AAF6BZA6_MARPO|nr:hypothetical protein MARPO_0009s0062 [Marchantia polymorpha]BBN17340.1 hypothetical protein Mp_7g13770 [Marchantia polymorpha subsp. ruderalis]|eukprot:PTQ46944.1 hypothetical protein MARPO_0009s0062 [Marchantia polymorpha]
MFLYSSHQSYHVPMHQLCPCDTQSLCISRLSHVHVTRMNSQTFINRCVSMPMNLLNIISWNIDNLRTKEVIYNLLKMLSTSSNSSQTYADDGETAHAVFDQIWPDTDAFPLTQTILRSICNWPSPWHLCRVFIRHRKVHHFARVGWRT